MNDPSQVRANKARQELPMRKFWKSDFYLNATQKSVHSELGPPRSSERPLICVSDEEVNVRESLADDIFLCDPLLETKSASEQLWTKNMAETINNVSRECLDRLAKLESENIQLRKQYENLEAQITPLVKSLKAQERLQHPENGRTPQAPVNYTRQPFETQLRQLVSVLVHTNIAQNDIREDCRYLKHRVSNLESINARLFHMVQNQQRVHCDHHSCQEISKHPHIDQTELCFPDENDEPRPMFPSMPGSHIHLSPGNSRSVRLDQSVVPSNSNSPKNDNSHLQINRASSPQEFTSHYPASRSVNERPPNAVVPITRTCLPREQSTLSSTETMRTLECNIKERLLTGCFQSVLEGVLLRATSTPHFPLSDPDVSCLTVPCCPSTIDDRMSHEAKSLPSKVGDWSSTNGSRLAERRTSFPLPAPSGISNSCCSKSAEYDRCGPVAPLRRRGSLPGMHDDAVRSVLLPHAWLHMSILPETAVRRHPIGTRSHIILGARSLPLCMNHSVDKSSVSRNTCQAKPSLSDANHNAAVLTTIGSPMSSRQIRGFHTQLNTIQEIEMKGESLYDLHSEPRRNSTRLSSSSSGSVLQNSTSDLFTNETSLKSPASDHNAFKLRKMRRVLCRDSKRRYLYSLRFPAHDNFSDKEHSGTRVLDLELASYLQTLVHNARESQRDLRYGVFSDTELLTGKFTITSRDDSAIDTGEDEGEGLHSSRESLEDIGSTGMRQMGQLKEDELKLSDNGTYPPEEPCVSENDRDEMSLPYQPLPENRPHLVNDLQKTSPQTLSPITLKTQSDQPDPDPEYARQSNHASPQTETRGQRQYDWSMLEVLEENGEEESSLRQQRPNLPPPVIIHRRRFGISESTEKISPEPMLTIDEVDEPQAQTIKQQLSAQKQQRKIPLRTFASEVPSVKAEISLDSLIRPINSENLAQTSGGESTNSDLYEAISVANVFTNTTTSSTTESTSGSDLNEISSQTTNLQNSSSRLRWFAKPGSISNHRAEEKKCVYEISSNNKKVENEHEPQKLVTSSYHVFNTKTEKGFRENSEYPNKPARVHGDSWGQELVTYVSPRSISSKTIWTNDPISNSPVANPRPATSPRIRRQSLVHSSKSSTGAKTANSTRSPQTAQMLISSKSSPNSPDFSPGGERGLRIATAKISTKSGLSKNEWKLPNQFNGAMLSKRITQGKIQVAKTIGVSSNGVGEGSDMDRFNEHTAVDLSATPAPPPIPPRTSSRTQGHQTKTITVARPDISTQPSVRYTEKYSPSSLSTQSILADPNWSQFPDPTRLRNSSHTRTSSSTTSYNYSSRGAALPDSSLVNNINNMRLINDYKRSPISNLSHSPLPRLPIPVARHEIQGNAWPTKPSESGSPNYSPQNGSLASQFETQLTGVTVTSRGSSSVNKNMPRAEHRSSQTRGKKISEITNSVVPTSGLWDTRGRHIPAGQIPHVSASQWSEASSRESSRSRGYTKERSVRRGA